MILGSISSWEAQSKNEHPAIVKAIDELIRLAECNPEPGRIEVQGDLLYINVMQLDAKPVEEQMAEKHEMFLDVHYLIEGKEIIGWSPLRTDSELSKPYDSEGDYAIYEPAADEVLLSMNSGMFVVFFPYDIHRPGMGSAGKIKKAVAKIHVSLLHTA